MAVQPGSLEILERAHLPPQQARAIVQAIELEIAGAKATLATKSDLLVMGSELRSEMSELRSEMAQLRSELRSEFRSGLSELRTEVHGMASSITRQMYSALLGQMAVLLGIAYFFVSHLTH